MSENLRYILRAKPNVCLAFFVFFLSIKIQCSDIILISPFKYMFSSHWNSNEYRYHVLSRRNKKKIPEYSSAKNMYCFGEKKKVMGYYVNINKL